MEVSPEQGLSAWVWYLRDMGVYDLYRRDQSRIEIPGDLLQRLRVARPVEVEASVDPGESARDQNAKNASARAAAVAREAAVRAEKSVAQVALPVRPTHPASIAEPVRNYFGSTKAEKEGELPPVRLRSAPVSRELPPELAAPMPKPSPLETLLPVPAPSLPGAERPAALERLRAEIGDCTRCPLAYAGRHTIVFGEGDPNAVLMFVGEGPGADEDASGRPFVGKAGQLLDNMIGAMGLQREQVYIANVVKCRPPGNRTPEFVEATTCSQFLLQQIDVVRPRVIVALGATAATYVLGVRQSLASLRGQWFSCREAKVAVTYHPAFLLRDPRQKAEAWKDLQRVMAELGLKASSRTAQT